MTFRGGVLDRPCLNRSPIVDGLFKMTMRSMETMQVPRESKKKMSALSPQAVRRKVSSVDQMAQMCSYYNVKSFGTSNDSVIFMEEVKRRRSVVGTLLMPMMVTGGMAASTAHNITDGAIRTVTVYSH